jgi:hypothetical protein
MATGSKETNAGIPENVVEASRSRFLFWCDTCRQAFEPKPEAYGLPYNGIQRIICDDCVRRLSEY